MNSKKRKEIKQIVTLCVCAAVIIALVIVYSIIQNNADAEGEDTEALPDVGISGQFTIIDEDYTRITALSYDYINESLAFHVENSTWQLDGDAAFPVDQEKLIMMAQAISDYGGYRQMVYDSTKDSAYGFDDPLYKISATYLEDDDTTAYTREYMIGNKNNLTGYYYFHVTGDTSVYMVNDALFTYFNYIKKDIFKADSLPAPELDDIIDLTVDYNGTEQVLTPAEESDDTADTADTDTQSPADPVAVIMEALTQKVKLSYDTQIDYDVTDADVTEYGLDNPGLTLKLHYYDYEEVTTDTGISSAKIQKETNFSLHFGKTAMLEREVKSMNGQTVTEQVEMVYVTVPGSSIVYAVEAAVLDTVKDAAGLGGPDSQ